MTSPLLTSQSPDWVRTGLALLERGLAGDYRTLPRVSNSDLTRLKEEHLGCANNCANGYGLSSARPGSEPVRRFGSQTFSKAFHQHLLEPESVGTVLEQLLPDLTNDRLSAARLPDDKESLMQAVRNDSFCRRYLRLAERNAVRSDVAFAQTEQERVVLFTEPITQVACKARLDLVHTSSRRQNTLVVDFKTTSARTQAQFLQSCYDYDYDRQAAFYLDSLRHADSGEWDNTRRFRFVFIGVMKQEPHRLFAVDATSLPGFVEYGRKKYRFWLKKWQETNSLMD